MCTLILTSIAWLVSLSGLVVAPAPPSPSDITGQPQLNYEWPAATSADWTGNGEERSTGWDLAANSLLSDSTDWDRAADQANKPLTGWDLALANAKNAPRRNPWDVVADKYVKPYPSQWDFVIDQIRPPPSKWELVSNKFARPKNSNWDILARWALRNKKVPPQEPRGWDRVHEMIRRGQFKNGGIPSAPYSAV